MLRARKVLGNRGTIDHHSDCGGFTTSPTTNYMELYPFIDRLWWAPFTKATLSTSGCRSNPTTSRCLLRIICRYGEGFDYNTPSADYWLAEISGLPSGLSADLLRWVRVAYYHQRRRIISFDLH